MAEYKLQCKTEYISDLRMDEHDENFLTKAIDYLNKEYDVIKLYQSDKINEIKNCDFRETFTCNCKDCDCFIITSLKEIPLDIPISEKLIFIHG